MKRLSIVFTIIIFIIAVFLIPTKVFAAGSFSISRGSASLNPGGTTTITITASNCAGQFSISSSNSSVATVNNSSAWLDNSSITVTVTAKSAGTATINIKAVDVTDTDLNDVTGTKTCTITVTNPAPAEPETPKPSNSGSSTNTSSGSKTSSNTKTTTTTTQKPKTETPQEVVKSSVSTLKELSIEGQTILPEFDVDVKEYTLSIPYETTTLKVIATPMDEKATAKIEGNEELKEGENIITITVTAEDESTSTYTIKVKREREPLTVKTLVVKYINQEGNTIEILLEPKFDAKTLEYTLEDLEYWVDKLLIEVKPNLDKATIKIEGADNLSVGENTITITVSIIEEVEEGQEPKEEKIVYTIKVNKNAQPTFMEKVKDKFKGIFGGIYSWYNNNQEKIIVYALCSCVAALIILSVYIVIDYSKYKTLIAKLKKLEEFNSQEVVQENIGQTSIDDIQNNNIQNEEIVEDDEPSKKIKGGKHF